MEISDILASIKPRIRDVAQENRIRQLYDRTHVAYSVDRKQGIHKELEADWTSLQTKFSVALEKVKKAAGLS